jgi:hypothetical protein
LSGPCRVGSEPHTLLAPAAQYVGTRAFANGHNARGNQLFERRLELGAELRPVDALERRERRLDRGALPGAGDVRPQPRTP